MPRVEGVNGSLELTMEHRENRTTSGNFETRSVLDSNLERVKLGADGYVYHPGFMLFGVSGGAGLTQGSYTSDNRTQKTSQFFDEYELKTLLLPKHPYNLELFTRRRIAPVYPLSPERTITSSQGAIFHYRKRPLALYLSAVSQSIERRDSLDTKQYSGGASYWIGPLRNTAGYTLTDSSTSQGTRAVRTTSFFRNVFKLSDVTLESNVQSVRQRQTNPKSTTSSIWVYSSEWKEQLNVLLPLNFAAYLAHDYSRDVTMAEQTQPSFASTELFNRFSKDSFLITHMLYKSLRSSYGANKLWTQSTGGDSKGTEETLAFAYNKNIPAGTLDAGYSIQNRLYTRSGTVTIVNEHHTAPASGVGSFFLDNQLVDQSTIVVMVTDPGNNQLVLLALGTNYDVQRVGNTLQIYNLILPGSIVVLPSYDFLVIYSLLPNDTTIKIRGESFNLGFVLFDGFFHPYYSRSTVDQKIVTGAVADGNDNSITTTYGAIVHKSAVTLTNEFVECQSDRNPFRSKTTSVNYRQSIREDVDIGALLSHSEIERPATEDSREYFENTNMLTITAHKAYVNARLNFSAGGSYQEKRLTGGRSESYSFNPSMTWRVGQVDITAFITQTYTVVAGEKNKQTIQESAYYLTVSRTLF